MAESDNAKPEPLRSSCPFLEEEATGTDMDLPFTASQKVCVFFFSVAHYFPYNCANRNMKLISRMAVISNIFIMFAQTLGETIQFDFAPQPNKLEPFHSQNSPFSPGGSFWMIIPYYQKWWFT